VVVDKQQIGMRVPQQRLDNLRYRVLAIEARYADQNITLFVSICHVLLPRQNQVRLENA
jgi:hypothetical protein